MQSVKSLRDGRASEPEPIVQESNGGSGEALTREAREPLPLDCRNDGRGLLICNCNKAMRLCFDAFSRIMCGLLASVVFK